MLAGFCTPKELHRHSPWQICKQEQRGLLKIIKLKTNYQEQCDTPSTGHPADKHFTDVLENSTGNEICIFVTFEISLKFSPFRLLHAQKNP